MSDRVGGRVGDRVGDGIDVGTAVRGITWYLRQVTGESKWDEYLERCRAEDREPMTRRAFERHRADVREHTPQSRCC